MHLIGITGPKRSGKGTVAEVISAVYNDGSANVKAVGFADKVKIAGMKALGFDRPDEELVALADQFKLDAELHVEYGDPDDDPETFRVHDLTGREYLQWVGTEVGRDLLGENFWVDQVLPDPALLDVDNWQEVADEQLRNRYPGVDCLCITDLRFENEALRVLALGGQVWEVTGRTEYSREHASEMPLPRGVVSQYVDNSGALIDLELQVEDALNAIPFD